MANQDKITVWMNGKKTTMKRDAKSLSQEEITRAEHAATMDEQPYHNGDTLKLPKKDDSVEKRDFSTTGKRGPKWKPIIVTILAAICMGSIFGMIMLKVVGTIGDYGSGQSSANVVSSNTNDEENDSKRENGTKDASVYTIQAQKAYVIQGGVFEQEASINDWKTSFQDAALSPVVWEQDDSYYLFVGIRQTKEQATAMVKEMKKTFGFDVFVKEWQTSQVELSLNQEGQKWMDSVIKLWEASLENVSNDTKLSVADWQDLQENSPDDVEQLKPFISKLTTLISDLDDPSRKEGEAFLLQVWSTLETNLSHDENS